MGDILGAGSTHYPPLISPDEDRAFPLTRTLKNNDKIPEKMKSPTSWPEPMRIEYGEDEGLKSAAEHRARLVKGFRQVRAAIDDFSPDIVLIWGDDQYENFREDIIPPFCVLAYDEFESQPIPIAMAATAVTFGKNHKKPHSPTKALPRRAELSQADS